MKQNENFNHNEIVLMLQQEAVPGESINNLVSRENEFYLPKRIRGTNSFFDVILSAQVSAYVWSSHHLLSRSASLLQNNLLH